MSALRLFVTSLACLILLGAFGCGGTSTREELKNAGPPSPPYPAGPYGAATFATLADTSFDGVSPDGSPSTLHLRDYYEPDATHPHLLVIRVHGGAWCGTCRWHAGHTGELVAIAPSRLRVLDLLLTDADGNAPRPRDAASFRTLVDAPDEVAIGVDPRFVLRAAGGATGLQVPLFLFVDTRTMTVRGVAENPDPTELRGHVERHLSAIDGTKVPLLPEETLVDSLFHRNEWDMIRDVVLPAAPPPDETNAVADAPAAAALGGVLFFDAELADHGKVACASCHDPKQQLSDGKPRAEGLALGDRKTPRITFAAFSRWQFWDGRADTLWSQALGPLENAVEMGSDRLYVARHVIAEHRDAFVAAFPDATLPDFSRLPLHGKPGEPTWDALDAADRELVTRLFVDVGKAIAAYERTFRAKPNALDAYAAGDLGALGSAQKQGLSVFIQLGCMQCHHGPRLTDDAFHVTRMATGRLDGLADRGRIDGIEKLLAAEFGAASRYSDAPFAIDAASNLVSAPNTLGAFKTPALRGVGSGGPFGHGGQSATLVAVTESYGQNGLPEGDPRAFGTAEPWLEPFDVTAQWALAPFLVSLTAEPRVPIAGAP